MESFLRWKNCKFDGPSGFSLRTDQFIFVALTFKSIKIKPKVHGPCEDSEFTLTSALPTNFLLVAHCNRMASLWLIERVG